MDQNLPDPSLNTSEEASEEEDMVSEKSPEDWLSSYNEAVEKSWLHAWPVSEFISVWGELLDTVYVTHAPLERFLDCCYQVIQHFPYSTRSSDKHLDWTSFLKRFYNKISEDAELYNSDRVKEIMTLAKNTYAFSHSRAALFWKLTHTALKDMEFDKATYVALSLKEYKQQFAHSYPTIDVDYEKFKSWAKNVKLSRDEILLVQKVFLKEEDKEELKNPYPEFTAEFAEPNAFMKWVEKASGEEKLIARCEEMVCQWPANACFYVCYLMALVKILPTTSNPESNRKRLYYLVRRGMRDIVDETDYMYERFVELSVNMAGQFLETDQLTELVKLTETKFDIMNWSLYISSRRVIMSVLYDAVQQKKLGQEELFPKLQNYLAELKGSMVTGDFMELALQCISYENKIKSQSPKEAFELFKEIFSDINDPHKYLAYTYFVRCQGPVPQIDESYKDSLKSLEKSMESDSPDSDLYNSDSISSRLNRLGYLQLLRNYLAFKYVHGSLQEQRELTLKLAKKMSDYGTAHNECYWLKPNIDHVGMDQVFSKGKETGADGLYKTQDEQSNHTDSEVTARLDEVKMDESEEDLRIFLSNIDFKVKDTEIKAAFQTRDIEVVNVNLKKNKQGQSEGYGTVLVKTKEQQNLALFLNRMMIGKREAFISRFEDKKKQGANKTRSLPRPTLLVISAPISEPTITEWADPKKLQAIFAPFGHIKSIVFPEKTDKVTARVEFHMSEDAQNAYAQWKERSIFKDIPVSMNVGFMKSFEKKKTDVNHKKSVSFVKSGNTGKMDVDYKKPVAFVKSAEKRKMEVDETLVTNSSTGAETTVPAQAAARFLPEGEVREPAKKTPRVSSLVPTQIKRTTNQMKPKLSVPSAADKTETPMDEDLEEQPQKKLLSNDDFRNLLTKKE